MDINKLKINPDNPQTFQDDDLEKLANSIEQFPKMMKLRPIVYDPVTMKVLGGNKRLLAMQRREFKEIPDEWIKSADELTEDEKHRFIIQDNLYIGNWDQEKLQDWDNEKLEEWGLDVKIEEQELPEFDDKEEEKERKTMICPKCGFEWEIESK